MNGSVAAVSEPDIGLLDVVPWTHGYAHSWAVRWILDKHPAGRQALMHLFVPDRAGPWEISDLRLEPKFHRHRADLTFEAVGAHGETARVIVETKVNDDMKDGQLKAYCEASEHVVLYVPGLTGLLLAENPHRHQVRWVSGSQLADALSGVHLPHLLKSYVQEVAGHARDMEHARAAARGERDDLPPPREGSGVRVDDLEAVAWVVETARFMRERGARPWTRNTRHDYGIYWPVEYDDERFGASAYVDVVAAHGGRAYAITIKTGDGEADDRRQVFDAASESPGSGWRRNNRSSAANYRLWTLDAAEMTAVQAADAAMAAGAYLQRLLDA